MRLRAQIHGPIRRLGLPDLGLPCPRGMIHRAGADVQVFGTVTAADAGAGSAARPAPPGPRAQSDGLEIGGLGEKCKELGSASSIISGGTEDSLKQCRLDLLNKESNLPHRLEDTKVTKLARRINFKGMGQLVTYLIARDHLRIRRPSTHDHPFTVIHDHPPSKRLMNSHMRSMSHVADQIRDLRPPFAWLE